MNKSGLIVPEEKWIDELRVHDCDPAQTAEIVSQLADGLPELLNVEGYDQALDRNTRQLIDATLLAINEIRLKLGLESVLFGHQRVHLLTATDWEQNRYLSQFGDSACCAFGRCYLQRHSLRRCAIDLTHEMSHALGYYSVDVALKPNGKLWLEPWRMGLAISSPDGPLKYNGLNEAVTELLATNLRLRVADCLETLESGPRLKCNTVFMYYPHVRLVQAIANESPYAAHLNLHDLYRDYFAGSNVFLTQLFRCDRRAFRALRDLSDDLTAPLPVAEALDLSAAAADIRQISYYRG